MGRVYIQWFKESYPDFDFYMCKTCRTDIALCLDGYSEDPAANSGLQGVRNFLEVRNVFIDEKVPWKAGPHTVADTHCVKCMDLIGFKFIEVSTDVERIIRDGDFPLIMEKLQYCDGVDVRAARQNEQVAAGGMEEQEEEPAEAAEQEQAAEMGEQEQAAAIGEQEEEPAEAAEQEQDVEMGEQEQAAAVGEQEEEPAEAAEQGQDVEMGEQEQAAAVEEQLPEDP